MHSDIAALAREEDKVPPISPSLAIKIALFLKMGEEVICGHRTQDRKAVLSFFDSAEYIEWIDKMDKAGKIVNTHYINAAVGSRR